MDPIAIVLIFILLALVFRLIAGGFDGERVEGYVRERGWELIDKSWDPFGPGWFGEKNSRIYQIVYRDKHGHLHRAHVKTSMLSGVYLTGDEIVENAPKSPAIAGDSDLAAENARLRARIAALEADRD